MGRQLAEITIEKIEWLFDVAYRTLGTRPINEIDAIKALSALPGRSQWPIREYAANAQRSEARLPICNRGRPRRCDVAANLRAALTTPEAKHHAAITTEKEAGALMRAIDGYKGPAITLFALRLTPHVFVRPGELRQTEREEFDFNKAIWSIPAEKMKMRQPHRVPISRQAMAILEELDGVSGNDASTPDTINARTPSCPPSPSP